MRRHPARGDNAFLIALALAQGLLVVGCGGEAGLLTGQVNSTQNPLVAKYSVFSAVDANITVQFGLDTSYGRQTWTQPAPAGGGEVDFLVAGMRPGTTYHMQAVAELADGSKAHDKDHVFTTGSVPASRLPAMEVTRPSSFAPNGGIELLDLISGIIGSGTNNQYQVAAADMDGNLIWYYDFNSTGGLIPQPVKLLPNGHMLLVLGSANESVPFGNVVREIDLAGNTVSEFSAEDLGGKLVAAGYNIPVGEMHHDILPLPNGHLIVLINYKKTFTDLPGYPGDTQVLGDALVDLDENRNVVWAWSTFDHLDVNRHPLLFPDWTHSNQVIYSPDDGNLLLSMRHQNWIIKIDYEDGRGSGDVLWRLGSGGDFTLQGGQPTDWFYAQHYPIITSPNTTGTFDLLLFDNGNNRVVDSNGTLCGSPQAIPCYSRVPLFEINEAAKTANILWQDKLSDFSLFGGAVELFPDENVEFGETAAVFSPATARVVEVIKQTPPVVVWQLQINLTSTVGSEFSVFFVGKPFVSRNGSPKAQNSDEYTQYLS